MTPFTDVKRYGKENLPENLRGFCVRSIVMLKTITTIETRNGWWNWQGDTGYLWHTVSAFDFNIEESKRAVEKNRKRGSFFEMKECPIIALEIGDSEYIAINLYNNYKYITATDTFSGLSTVQDFINKLRSRAPLYMLHAENVDKENFVSLSESETLCSYKSAGVTSKALNWSISRENVDLKCLLLSIETFNRRCIVSQSSQVTS